MSRKCDAVLLEVCSSLVTAHKAVRVKNSHIMTTSVRYERRMGRATWLTVVPIHQQTEPKRPDTSG
jgi:hypothetical protein